MRNEEKADLKQLVIAQIRKGSDMKEAVKRIERLGFSPSTIRKYYKTFKETQMRVVVIRGSGKASQVFKFLALLAKERGTETLGQIIEREQTK